MSKDLLLLNQSLNICLRARFVSKVVFAKQNQNTKPGFAGKSILFAGYINMFHDPEQVVNYCLVTKTLQH